MADGAKAWRGLLLGAIAAGLLVSTGAGPSVASGETPSAVTRKLEKYEALWAKVAADPAARLPVIVRFDMPVLPDAASFDTPAAADQAQTRAIHTAQDRILAAAFPQRALSSAVAGEKNLKRMDFSPMFGIVASADEIARFAADPNVTLIQEDGLSKPSLNESLPLIQMPAMYAAGATGSGHHVAVLDTGGRRSHQFLSSRINSEACYNTTGIQGSVSQCPGGASSSTSTGSGEDCTASNIFGCGHGTHVAGTVAGYNTAPASGQPTSGVARDARLISINVFSRFPANAGSPCGAIPGYAYCVLTFDTDQIRGLERVYALRNTHKIAAVNMSLGGGEASAHCDNDARKPIIDQLRAARIATVIAAGNDGYDTAVGAPGCISSAVTVGSSTKWDFRSDFSNWGNLIDVVAPGSDIYSSYINGSANNYFSFSSGTSMASPHVAGAFAALRDAFPNATVDQIENALKSTGEGVSSAGVVKPRINVNDARIALGGGTPPPTGPANNHFVNRITVPLPAVGATRTVTGSNVGGTAEGGEPIHAARHSALNSVWWRYTPTASGLITIDTLGSNFDTVLAVYRGSSVTSLVEVASNDDTDFYTVQSQVRFNGTAGVEYQIAVAGYMNEAGNIRLSVHGGVAAPVPPANDNFANRIMIPPHGAIFGPRTVTANNTHATAQAGEPQHASRPVATNSVWWRYTPATSGRITIDTNGSNFNTVLAVYTGSAVGGLRVIAANDDDPDLGRRSKVTFNGIAGTQYQIAVAGGYGNNSGHVRMTVRGGGRYDTTPRPANDNLANRIMIPPHGAIFGPRSVTANNTHATAEPGEPLHANRSVATNSVWWRYTPATSGRITIDTRGSSFNTVLAVYTGNSVRGLRVIAANDDDPSLGRRSKVVFDGVAGTQYQIAVAGGYGNNSGHIRMTVRGGGRYVVNPDSHQVANLSSSGRAGPDSIAATLTASGTASERSAPSSIPVAVPTSLSKQDSVARPAAGASNATPALTPERASQAASTSSATQVRVLGTVVASGTNGFVGDGVQQSIAMLAVTNVGSTGATLTAELSFVSTDGVSIIMPAGLSICRTDASSGTCVGRKAPSVVFDAEPGEFITFAAFVGALHEASAFQFGNGVLQAIFRQDDAIVGSASLNVDSNETVSSL